MKESWFHEHKLTKEFESEFSGLAERFNEAVSYFKSYGGKWVTG